MSSTSDLSLFQIAGINGPTYEDLYNQAKPDENGYISAINAANFLKLSSLSQRDLAQIWTLSDTQKRGHLDKHDFFLALKFVALAQNSQEISVKNLTLQCAAPLFSRKPNSSSISSTSSTTSGGLAALSITMEHVNSFGKTFDSFNLSGRSLPGAQAREILMKSGLSNEQLGKIWALSDIESDGTLDRDEFIMAMFLVGKAREGVPIPAVLPPQLIPPGKQISNPSTTGFFSSSFDSSGNSAALPSSSTSAKEAANWIVKAEEKTHSDQLFAKFDTDQDGFVSGIDIKDYLMQFGLSQTSLAQIWDLCDIKKNGLLNNEQFALIIHLMKSQLNTSSGANSNSNSSSVSLLPTVLQPEMIPPSLRGSITILPTQEVLTLASFGIKRESDDVYEEIEKIKKEKSAAERSIAQFESELKLKKSESQMLAKNLEQISGTVASLANQKVEAQKRLDVYAEQKQRLEASLAETKTLCQQEKAEIESLKSQQRRQQMSIKSHKSDLVNLQAELNELLQREKSMVEKVRENKQRLEAIEQESSATESQISEMQSRASAIEDAKQRMTQLIDQYDALIRNPLSSSSSVSVSASANSIKEPDELAVQQLIRSCSSLDAGFSSSVEDHPLPQQSGSKKENREGDATAALRGPGEDPFGGATVVSASNLFATPATAAGGEGEVEDPFKENPFANDGAAAFDFFSSPIQGDVGAAAESASKFDAMFQMPPPPASVSQSGAPGGADSFSGGAIPDPFGDPFSTSSTAAPASNSASTGGVGFENNFSSMGGAFGVSSDATDSKVKSSSTTSVSTKKASSPLKEKEKEKHKGKDKIGGGGKEKISTAQKEQDQMAWATLESKRIADEAKRKKDQEEEDFQLALKISQLETSGGVAKSSSNKKK